MFGKGVFQEEDNLLRDIIRSIDKRLDFSAKEGAGTRFTVHVKLRGHEADVMLDLKDLKAARTDMVKRQQIRHKIKARCDHLDKSRYGDDVLGLKSARILRASPKPEAPRAPRWFRARAETIAEFQMKQQVQRPWSADAQ